MAPPQGMALRAGWVVVVAILLQGMCAEGVSEDSSALLPGLDLSKLMLGEGGGEPPSAEQLTDQNQKLQGAISAIESGVPPPGMEAMGEAAAEAASEIAQAKGGGAAAPGEAASAASESQSISEGIKMAMKSVKPLMDKYVATARALTNKYSLLKKRYKAAAKAASECQTEKEIQARIDLAVKKATLKERKAQQEKQAELKKEVEEKAKKTQKMLDGMTLKMTKEAEEYKGRTSEYEVEFNQAKQNAKTELTHLNDRLKALMMQELKKRDEAIELQQKKDRKEMQDKQKEKDTKEKSAKEKKEKERLKKEASKAKIRETAEKKKEVIKKKEAAKEAKAKEAAAREEEGLNRQTVMLKARGAMMEARKAARMARKLSRDADDNVDSAKLKMVKKVADQDVAALSKLRHHEDLAQTAVDSAQEKRTKISRYEDTAEASLSKSKHRWTMLRKETRWDSRHVQSMKDIARRAFDKAERLKNQADSAAANAGMPAPAIDLPERISTDDETGHAAMFAHGRMPGERGYDTSISGTNSKIMAAHLAREKARQELAKDGVPIPPGLQPGEMALLKTKMQNAGQNVPAGAGAAAQDPANSPTELKPSSTAATADATEPGHTARVKIRKHSEVKNAQLKTKIAKEKLDLALEKREKARIALKAENKPVPETLKKGGLDEEKRKLETAAQKASTAAQEMEAEEEEASTNKEALAQKAETKIDAASEKREAAREFLEEKGDSIPENLKKGGMDTLRQEAKDDEEKAAADINEIAPSDSKKTASVKKQSVAVEAELKAQLAGAKVEKAMALRQKARDALKAEGKEVPDALQKGALADVKARADAAIQKAKVLKVKAAEDAAVAGTAADGVTPGNVATCYEAELSKYPKCGGYKEEGFSCSDDHEDGKSGYCAADKCINDCDKCSKKAPSGHVVNVKTGRCVPQSAVGEEELGDH